MDSNQIELCSDVIAGLTLLSHSDRISVDQLTRILDVVCQSLQSGQSSSILADQSAEEKLLSVSLACLFVETCRTGSSLPDQLSLIRSTLDSVQSDPDLSNAIVAAFSTRSFHSALVKRLQSATLSDPDVYSSSHVYRLSGKADIRQDYVIKSRKSSWQQITQTEYVMRLPTLEDRDIWFSCSLQNIEDMTIKLRECLNKIERTFSIVQDAS
jgi:hypothetical protein